MNHEERMKELQLQGNFNKERMFPILNKIDKLWLKNDTLQFCEIIKLIGIPDTDLELTKRLDEIIDGKQS